MTRKWLNQPQAERGAATPGRNDPAATFPAGCREGPDTSGAGPLGPAVSGGLRSGVPRGSESDAFSTLHSARPGRVRRDQFRTDVSLSRKHRVIACPSEPGSARHLQAPQGPVDGFPRGPHHLDGGRIPCPDGACSTSREGPRIVHQDPDPTVAVRATLPAPSDARQGPGYRYRVLGRRHRGRGSRRWDARLTSDRPILVDADSSPTLAGNRHGTARLEGRPWKGTRPQHGG